MYLKSLLSKVICRPLSPSPVKFVFLVCIYVPCSFSNPSVWKFIAMLTDTFHVPSHPNDTYADVPRGIGRVTVKLGEAQINSIRSSRYLAPAEDDGSLLRGEGIGLSAPTRKRPARPSTGDLG
ncbi:hypothetical protein Acr_22g0004610 [Actinidia rufa]|uniref:Uncharacterized protein n=1 Tax=Actinidia rufa TaxID=165716 RepID=A0A7J0GJT5_9ERIC|nr:hypothetical protein Acr_22g0004610 [Actinidia rufa]